MYQPFQLQDSFILPTKQEKFSKTTLEVFSILESFGWVISFVISTNKFEESRTSMTGQSLIILKYKILDLRKQIENKKQEKLQEFSQDENIYLNIINRLIQLLPNNQLKDEMKILISMQDIVQQQYEEDEPKILEYFHRYQMIVPYSLHDSIKQDIQGDQFTQKICLIEQEFSKLLYFDLQDQAVNVEQIKDLISIIIIGVVQNCQLSYQKINDFFKSFDDDQIILILPEVKLIGRAFDDLKILFYKIQQALEDEQIQIDGEINMKLETLELLQLIYDNFNYMMTKIELPQLKISIKTKEILIDVSVIYNQQLNEENAKKYFNKFSKLINNLDEYSQLALQELNQVCYYLISSKLRFLINSMWLYVTSQSYVFNETLFKFHYRLLKDKEFLDSLSKLKVFEPEIFFPSVNFNQLCEVPFFKILKLLAKIEEEALDERNIDHKETFQEINSLFQGEKEKLCKIQKVKELKQLSKYQENLFQFLRFQKLDNVVYQKLFDFADKLKYIQDKLNQYKEQETPGDNALIEDPFEITLARIVFYYNEMKQKYSQLKILHQKIPQNQIIHLNSLIKEIKQYNDQNQRLYINNVKQFTYEPLKEYIQKLNDIEQNKFNKQIDLYLKCFKHN